MDDFQKHLQESLKDEAFRAEYEVKELRIQYKLTQAELAKKLGTTQTVVSRIENGSVNVGIDFLQKLGTFWQEGRDKSRLVWLPCSYKK